jgi:hypothetical protein
MSQAGPVKLFVLFFHCSFGRHGSPCGGFRQVPPFDRYLNSERIIERMSMIENAIRMMRSHFVLLGSLVFVGLFF